MDLTMAKTERVADGRPQRNYESDPVSPALRKQFEEKSIEVLWEISDAVLARPQETMRAWPWRDIRPLAIETAKITLPAIIERRVMQLVNPTHDNPGFHAASGLINAGIQALMPGEHARPHRHSMNALRFILEGAGAETIVEGKPCLMEPGDLVTTPGWAWHEHRNIDGAPTIWVDILDAAIHRAMGTAEFQPGPIVNAHGSIPDAAFSAGPFLPAVAMEGSRPYSPVFRYPWADAARAVAATPPAADGSRTVRYANPVTGGSALPTIDCYLQQIEPGAVTFERRTSASAVCVVVEGTGTTKAGDVTVEWGPKDVFTLPANTWAHHRCATGPARLFIASSREVYRRLGLLVEEDRA